MSLSIRHFSSLISTVWLTLLAVFAVSCQPMANRYQRQIIDCGDLAANSAMRIYRIDHVDAARAEVWDVDSATLAWRRLKVNDKGCFANPGVEDGHLIIRSADEVSGKVITKENFEGIKVVTLAPLKLSEQIPEICPEKSVHIAKNTLTWPVSLNVQEERDFFFVVLPDDLAKRAQASLLKSGGPSQSSLFLTGLADGSNEIKFSVYDLLRSDRKLSEQSCQFVVDKDRPELTVKDIRNQVLDGSVRTFAPGEKLFVSTSEPADVGYCIVEAGSTGDPACTSVRSDRTLDLPRSGSWSLQFQVEDRSGNMEIRRYGIEIFDQNAVELIRTQARMNTESKAGNLASIALELEASRQKLEGTREQLAVEPETRVAMLTSMLRTQEITRTPHPCKDSGKAIQVGNIILTVDTYGLVCAFTHKGDFLYTHDLPSLSALYLDRFKIYQNRFVIYSYGNDPRYQNQLRVFDSLDGVDKEIVINDLNAYIDDLDINPTDGTVFILTKSKSRGGVDGYLEVSFDGQVKLRKDLASSKYSYVSYLALSEAPRIVLGFTTFIGSREIRNPELCDLALTLCEKKDEFSPDFKDVFANREGTLLATNFKGKTLVWASQNSADLVIANAKESAGTFVQFLETDRAIVTSTTNAYLVGPESGRSDWQTVYGTLENPVNFIYDSQRKQTILINESGFERWIQNLDPIGKSGANDKTPIQDALVLHGVLNDQGTELTIVTSQYVARYQLAYANLNDFILFAGNKAGIMASPAEGMLIYTNAAGVTRKFASRALPSAMMLSPQKKYALLETRAFEGFSYQLINAEGEHVASAEGSPIKITLADADADDERLLYRLDYSDFILFDSAATEKVHYFNFENFEYNDTILLPKLAGQVMIVANGDIKLMSVKDRQDKLIASQASGVQTGKKFPFVVYYENSDTLVLKNLVTGDERRWNNASLSSIEESCHSLFVKQEEIKLFTVVDLRTFVSYDYVEGEAKCLHSSGQLVVQSSATDASSLLLDLNYNVLANLPTSVSWVSANQQGILLQRDISGLEFLSYGFDGKFIGKQEFDRERSQAYFMGQTRVELKHYTLLNQKSYLNGENPKQTRYELYGPDLELLAGSVLNENIGTLGRWELLGPVVWNTDSNQLYEITHSLTQEKLMDYLPVPSWDGVRFYPVNNGELFKVLREWIDARKKT